MGRRRTSVLWLVSREELESTIEQSESMAEVLRKYGLPESTGGNYRTLKDRCETDGIDLSDLRRRTDETLSKRMAKLHQAARIPLYEMLVEDCPHNRANVKRRLIFESVLEEVCSECGQGTEWNGKKLVLVLDHINGKNRDYRRENLRLLCPNCNSQMDTFAGRNVAARSIGGVCDDCGGSTSSKFEHRCRKCAAAANRKVKNAPGVEELCDMLKDHSVSAIAKMYGVSWHSVNKWAKKFGLR